MIATNALVATGNTPDASIRTDGESGVATVRTVTSVSTRWNIHCERPLSWLSDLRQAIRQIANGTVARARTRTQFFAWK